VTTESPIEKSFVRWCKDNGYSIKKLALVSEGGWPDRAVLLPNNRVCWIEFKSPTGRLDPIQQYVIRDMAKHGHKVFVCTSLGEAVRAIKELTE
jgi:hypothetical protein